VRIEGGIIIGRPIEDVFDFVADGRNEPSFKPWVVRAEQLTDGPIGAWTRFLATTTSIGRTIDTSIEFTTFERRTRQSSTTNTTTADTIGTLTSAADPAGTRMRWSWDVHPTGLFRLLKPLIHWLGTRQEEAIWASLKQHLEARTPPAQGPAALGVALTRWSARRSWWLSSRHGKSHPRGRVLPHARRRPAVRVGGTSMTP